MGVVANAFAELTKRMAERSAEESTEVAELMVEIGDLILNFVVKK
jgi:hypothetical protein